MQRMYGSDLWLPIVVCLDTPYLAGPGSHPHQPQQTFSLHVFWQCRRPWRSIFVHIWAALNCRLSKSKNQMRPMTIESNRFHVTVLTPLLSQLSADAAAEILQHQQSAAPLHMLLKKFTPDSY